MQKHFRPFAAVAGFVLAGAFASTAAQAATVTISVPSVASLSQCPAMITATAIVTNTNTTSQSVGVLWTYGAAAYTSKSSVQTIAPGASVTLTSNAQYWSGGVFSFQASVLTPAAINNQLIDSQQSAAQYLPGSVLGSSRLLNITITCPTPASQAAPGSITSH